MGSTNFGSILIFAALFINFFYSFIHLFVYFFIFYSFIYSFIYPFIYSCIFSFVDLFYEKYFKDVSREFDDTHICKLRYLFIYFFIFLLLFILRRIVKNKARSSLHFHVFSYTSCVFNLTQLPSQSGFFLCVCFGFHYYKRLIILLTRSTGNAINSVVFFVFTSTIM